MRLCRDGGMYVSVRVSMVVFYRCCVEDVVELESRQVRVK